ncbi:MAG: antibiotic biosynthesis monooxygenase [Bowdeniella nasicola]|nr:antibiotic biosynthesis monooxygenase [Bowdeniella nasicola]
MSLRILHEFSNLDLLDDLTREAAALRGEENCLSAEVYRAMGGEEHGALTLIWRDEVSYWALWDRVLTGAYPHLGSLARSGAISGEFYTRAPYRLSGGRWVPESDAETGRRIVWPARGAVRIIIQGAYETSADMADLTRLEVEETRREHGCLAYAWMANVELADHLMLVELWEDQEIYDHHWEIRTQTADFRGNSGRSPRTPERGLATREFYRHEAFTHLYDRWQPARVEDYSATVVWGPPVD